MNPLQGVRHTTGFVESSQMDCADSCVDSTVLMSPHTGTMDASAEDRSQQYRIERLSVNVATTSSPPPCPVPLYENTVATMSSARGRRRYCVLNTVQ